jgi:hypothetical protein
MHVRSDRLDDEWHKFMKTVRTPLEQNAEPGEPAPKARRGAPTDSGKVR